MPILIKQYQETQAISGLWTPGVPDLSTVHSLEENVCSLDPTYRNLAKFGYGILLGSGLKLSPDFTLEDLPGVELFAPSGEANADVLEHLEGLNNQESRLASAGLAIASLAYAISKIREQVPPKNATALVGLQLTEGFQLDTDKAESTLIASELLGMQPVERINIVHSFLPTVWRANANPNADDVVSDKTDIYLYARQNEKLRKIANWTLALNASKGRFDAYFSKTAPDSHVTAGRNNLFFDELHLVTRTLLRIPK